MGSPVSGVVVIGAGPAGLATAAMLRRAGARFRLIDRGPAGGAYGRMDPELVLTSPARLVGLPGRALRAAGEYPTAREYHDYLAGYARAHELAPEPGVVEAVAHEGAGYRIAVRRGEQLDTLEARAVIVATGVFDHPRVPAIAGLALGATVIHAAAWRGSHATPGRRVLVIGGASSAVEIAEACARAGSAVTVAARRITLAQGRVLGVDLARLLLPILARISPRRLCERGATIPGTDRGFAALRRRGAIAVRPPVTRLDGGRAWLADGTAVEPDLIVVATGYRFSTEILPTGLALTPRSTPRCADGESVSHRGLFFVGSPCARSAASQFLYGIARDAVAVAGRASALAGR